MKVYFAHGKESGPWGSKITALADQALARGCAVDSLDYTDLMDPEARVRRLLDALKHEPDEVVLVGSSMGGYVSLVAAEQAAVQGLFLLAPALFMPGYGHQSYHPRTRAIEIVHGWSDTVIPVEHSLRFARETKCALHLITGDHRLNSSLAVVLDLFGGFLDRIRLGRGADSPLK